MLSLSSIISFINLRVKIGNLNHIIQFPRKYLPFVAERRKNMNIFPFQRILLNIVRLTFIQYIFPDFLYRTMGQCFPNGAIKMHIFILELLKLILESSIDI